MLVPASSWLARAWQNGPSLWVACLPLSCAPCKIGRAWPTHSLDSAASFWRCIGVSVGGVFPNFRSPWYSLLFSLTASPTHLSAWSIWEWHHWCFFARQHDWEAIDEPLQETLSNRQQSRSCIQNLDVFLMMLQQQDHLLLLCLICCMMPNHWKLLCFGRPFDFWHP